MKSPDDNDLARAKKLDPTGGVARLPVNGKGAPARPLPSLAADAALEDWAIDLPPPIPTGMSALDQKIGGGLSPESSYGLIAPTGRGKTGLVLQIVRNLARLVTVLYFTSELTRRQALARVSAQELGEPWGGIYRAPSTSKDTIADSLRPLRLRADKLRVDDNIPDLAARIADADGQAPIVVLDYIQHAARRLNPDDRRLATAALSDGITRWAADSKSVALFVSAASRPWSSIEGKSGRDFETAAKESGDIEFDAAGLFFLESEPCPIGGTAPAKLHIAKSRFGGEGGVIGLCFHGALGTFTVDPAAGLGEDQQAALAAIRAGAASIDSVREAIGKGQKRVIEVLRQLAAMGAISRTPMRVLEGW